MKIVNFFFLLILLPTLLLSREINIDNLINKASTQNKHLFIFLHWTDCVYCQEMIMFTLDTQNIQKKIKKDFIYEHINTAYKDTVKYKDFNGTSKEFVKYIGFGYPTSVFFDQNKTIAGVFPGVYDEKEFAVILKYIKSGSYKTIEYDDYAKKMGLKEKD
ncbi:thioredoxin fold domain-containing protein [bacterium]|nr:thioredoxin fold domain-containing protein [bacterium]MBU1882921.1 thioredoxin fold domain-containing protein [bacterium]